MACEISPEKLEELKSLGGDALIEKLLGKFVESATKLLAEANTALAAQDAKKVDYCIHTLKGSSLSLGFNAMGDILTPLNVETKSGDLTNCAARLPELNAMLQEIIAYKAQNFP